MAINPKRTPVTPPKASGANPAAPPRTTATQRLREVWNSRLSPKERELVIEVLCFASDRVEFYASRRWEDIDPAMQAQIMRALRELVTLGNEASYALGYARRNA